jgi:hypothetical protein
MANENTQTNPNEETLRERVTEEAEKLETNPKSRVPLMWWAVE